MIYFGNIDDSEVFDPKKLNEEKTNNKTIVDINMDKQPSGDWVSIELEDGSYQKGEVHLHCGDCDWNKFSQGVKQLLNQKYKYNIGFRKVLTDEEVKKSEIDFTNIVDESKENPLAKAQKTAKAINKRPHRGPITRKDAGNVEYNTARFNANMNGGSADGGACTGCAESLKEDTNRKFKPTDVSVFVILRDWTDIQNDEYVNEEHKKLVDIADTLYNVGLRPEEFLDDYKELYDRYGEEFFSEVIEDATAIDSQVSEYNVKDLGDEALDVLRKYGTTNESLNEDENMSPEMNKIHNYVGRNYPNCDWEFTSTNIVRVFDDNGETVEKFNIQNVNLDESLNEEVLGYVVVSVLTDDPQGYNQEYFSTFKSRGDALKEADRMNSENTDKSIFYTIDEVDEGSDLANELVDESLNEGINDDQDTAQLKAYKLLKRNPDCYAVIYGYSTKVKDGTTFLATPLVKKSEQEVREFEKSLVGKKLSPIIYAFYPSQLQDIEDSLKQRKLLKEASVKRNEKKEVVCIYTRREDYSYEDMLDQSITCGDLEAILEGQYDRDLPIYFANDRGYTYGEISEDDISEETTKDGCCVIIEVPHSGYSPDQCRDTFIIQEFVDYLYDNFDEDCPIILSFNSGYTYGTLSENNIRQETFEGDDYSDLDESKLQERDFNVGDEYPGKGKITGVVDRANGEKTYLFDTPKNEPKKEIAKEPENRKVEKPKQEKKKPYAVVYVDIYDNDKIKKEYEGTYKQCERYAYQLNREQAREHGEGNLDTYEYFVLSNDDSRITEAIENNYTNLEDIMDSLQRLVKKYKEIKDFKTETVDGVEVASFTFNGKKYYLVPSTLSQVDLYDSDKNLIDDNVFIYSLIDEISAKSGASANFVYEIVGGKYSGEYTREEIEKLPIYNGTYTFQNGSNPRIRTREELQNQPKLKGLIGPMWNGWRENHTGCIRYETQEMYDANFD